MSQGHDMDPQPQDDRQLLEQSSLECDLYTLFATGKLLLGSNLLPEPLATRLEDLVRAIAGCSICGEMLGTTHGARCGLFEGRQVESYDLASLPSQNASKRDIAPF